MIPHSAAPTKCYGLNSLYFIFTLRCKQHWHLTIILMKSKKLFTSKQEGRNIYQKNPFPHYMLWSVTPYSSGKTQLFIFTVRYQ